MQSSQEQQQPQEMYEIEQWLVDFANLFRDQLGVEPDRHLDLTNFGWEKLQAALDTAVLDDKAPQLFDQAAQRFQEVTAHGAPCHCCAQFTASHLRSLRPLLWDPPSPVVGCGDTGRHLIVHSQAEAFAA